MRETLAFLRKRLTPLYGREEANAVIELIFLHLKGWHRVDMMINEDKQLSPYIKEKVNEILMRLEHYEPIQYITGIARFYGLDLKVRPGVLIPRPETAELVDIIVDANPQSDLRVLDVCTGSGCIAVALARNLRFPQVSALDISPEALSVARDNVDLLKVNVRLIEADIYKWEPDADSLDIIVSNPPYIDCGERNEMERNVLDYEPAVALFVPDDDPLTFYRRILEIGHRALVVGGKIYFEINPLHADDLVKMTSSFGFTDVELILDSFGKRRFLIAVNGEKV